MKIKNTTRLNTLFEAYPYLKMTVTSWLPALGDLEQKPLKEKVLAITTVEHLAQRTGRDVTDLIAELREAAGLDREDSSSGGDEIELHPDDPAWIKLPAHFQIDGVELLSEGKHPLSILTSKLPEIPPGELILLTTNFHPQPMIDAMQERGLDVFSRKDLNQEGLYLTFIKP